MFEGLFTVRHITSKNSFCFLSVNNFNRLQNNSVKLLYNDGEKTFVSVRPSTSGLIDDQSIGINSLFAKALGLEDSALVAVSEILKPPVIQSVTVSTNNQNDFEVLESLAQNVQSTLLDQVQVVGEGQVFVIHVGNMHLTVSVISVSPVSPGVLDFLTEFVIKPPELKVSDTVRSTNLKKEHSSLDFLNEYLSLNDDLILRLVPFKDVLDKIGNLAHPFNIFVFRDAAPNLKNSLENSTCYLMKSVNPEIDKFVYVKLIVFEDFLPNLKLNKICSENAYVSDTILEHFGCVTGTRVKLELCSSIPNVSEVQIYSKKNYSKDIVKEFHEYLVECCKHQECILSSDVIFNINKNLKCFIRFLPPKLNFCFVNADFIRNCKLMYYPESLLDKESVEKSDFSMDKYTTDVANYQDIIDKCLFLSAYNTKVFNKMYNILITGRVGCGKSTVVDIIAHLLNTFPYFYSVKKIDCKCVKGKTVESLHKLFSTVLLDLVHLQPAVLILEDLHVLCPKVEEGEGAPQQTSYNTRVSEMLAGLFEEFCEHNAVAILATAVSTSQLNKFIFSTRGNDLFRNVYNIEPLTRNDRRKLLEFLFKDYELVDVDLGKLAQQTESFVMQDLVDLANKTLFESYQEDPNQITIKITIAHCQKALSEVTSTAMANVRLQQLSDKNLDDIGGLTDAKKLLLETLLWPSAYPEIFSKAPLRLPSGLLLYGAPGTGKTLLAGAAARHCNLRLISIKGPELLSKYIGASEQAVRDVFERAQSAKPCVLFFDEFDSLAPRRGHDNTGVTDRVVNQFLTQLDGVQTLTGVFVIAATSRPDLLDPALLRPGRLDLHIRCPLPDQVSRLQILQCLSKNVKLSNDVDLKILSCATEGFSGADLQAVLYTAQMDAVKDLLDLEASDEEFQREVHQEQLLQAVQNTRPSLSKTELMKYEQIYNGFEGKGNTGFSPGSRATLA